jgi:hypothetical protein
VALVVVGLAALVSHTISLPDDVRSMVFHDELHYAQQARDVAAGGSPRYNGIWQPKYPPLYGALLSLPRLLARRDGFAFWSRVFNGLLLVSTLWPAYRLARRNLDRPWSLTASVLCVVGPWWIYPRLLMAENVLIPLVLALALALRRFYAAPTAARGIVAGVAFTLCVLTKTSMIVALPAAIFAAAWAWRIPSEARRAALWMGIGAFASAAPWFLRRSFLPSEALVPPLNSYLAELAHGGLQPVAHYAYWLRAEPVCFVVGLSPPVWIVALAGLLAWLRSDEPEARGTAAFVVCVAVLTSLQASIWVAQVATWAPKFQERYFVALWPLFILSFVRVLRQSTPSHRTIAVAALITASILILAPSSAFSPENAGTFLFDSPSFPQAAWVWSWTGSALQARAVFAASSLLAAGVMFGARKAAAVLIVCAVLYQSHSLWLSVRAVQEREYWARVTTQAPFRLLDATLRPGDVVVHHTTLGDLAYHVAMRYEMPLYTVDDDLSIQWDSPVRYVLRSGSFVFLKVRPTGRVFFLTRADLPIAAPRVGPLVGESGPYRLYAAEKVVVEQERSEDLEDDGGD